MRTLPVVALLVFVQGVASEQPDEIEDRIGGLNVYQGDDASAILQEAFAQAGVDLGGPIVPIAPAAPRLSLVQRLKNMRLPLPSLSAFSRRKVTPVPNMLIPLMPAVAGHGMPGVKTGKALNTNAHPGTHHMKEAAFIPAYNRDPAFINNQAAVIPQYTFPQESEVVKETLTASPSFHSPKTSVSDAVVRITAPPTPMATQVDKQTAGNNRTTANHSFKSVWIPSSHYFGGFKPIPASSSVQAAVSLSTPARTYEKSNSLSAEETKRVSFFESLDQEKSAFDHNNRRKEAKSMDIWRLNDSQVQQSVSELIKALPSDNKSQNKLFPITPAMLLEQMARMNSNRTAHECKNKDLGWCDFSETYPEHFVLAVIKECRDVIERMYVEVPQNLADFDDYVPFSPITSPAVSNNNSDMAKGPTDNAATWSWAGYRNKNNALCDADRKFVRPSVAQDITGRWFVIVQSSLYHQQVPTELCRNPGGVCNNISQCGLTARCVQRFNTQLLVSIDLDKESDCPTMRLYRFPSGCVCDNATYY